jgi:hypothetical protein
MFGRVAKLLFVNHRFSVQIIDIFINNIFYLISLWKGVSTWLKLTLHDMGIIFWLTKLNYHELCHA